MLSDTSLDTEQKDYVQTIKKSSDTLLNILNDILDLAKIEAGKMALHPRDIILRDVFERLMALFSQIAKQKGNTLSFDLAADIPECVQVDETRLLQVLSNLTSNALKFTENGNIQIDVSVLNKIDDRFDLTLECIRRHYLGIPSPLSNTLTRYQPFFELFGDLQGYVDFFLLNDLLDKNERIKFYLPFDEFNSKPRFNNIENYLIYKEGVSEFVIGRNARISTFLNP
jgi:hypothetical protein